MAAVVDGLWGLFSLGRTLTGNALHFLTAVFKMNYTLVSSVFRFIMNTYNAVAAFLTALETALKDIAFYLLEFFSEFMNLVYFCCKCCGYVGFAIYDLISLAVHSTETCINALVTAITYCMKRIGLFVVSSSQEICNFCYNIYSLICTGISLCANMVLLLGSTSVNLISGTYHGILNGMQNTYDALSYTCSTTGNAIQSAVRVTTINIAEEIIYFYTEYIYQIPVQAYLGLFLTVLLFLGARAILSYLSETGLTFSIFQSRELELEVPREPRVHNRFALDSSDDEDDDGDDDGDAESSDSQSVVSANDGNENLAVSDEDEASAADDNDADNSDDSDSSDGQILVELPQRDNRYSLRTRITPSPLPSISKISDPKEIERALENERDKRLCVVCQDHVKSVLVLPCKHMCLCVDCAHHIIQGRFANRKICPLCRGRIHTIMNVYV